MNKEEAKQWAELFTAYAEGKTIEYAMYCGNGKLDWVETTFIDLDHRITEYRIKPIPKKIRMTNQKFADWIRDCPEEHREWTWKNGTIVYFTYSYPKSLENDVVNEEILIRRNHGEWEEPLIEVEE